MWSAIPITRSLISSILCSSQSMSLSKRQRRFFKGRWLAISGDSRPRFAEEFGSSYDHLLIRVAHLQGSETYLDLIYSNLNCIDNIFVSELWPSRTRLARPNAPFRTVAGWGMTARRFGVGGIRRVRSTLAWREIRSSVRAVVQWETGLHGAAVGEFGSSLCSLYVWKTGLRVCVERGIIPGLHTTSWRRRGADGLSKKALLLQAPHHCRCDTGEDSWHGTSFKNSKFFWILIRTD